MTFPIEKLHEYLNYDPNTGVFKWIKKSAKNVMAGSIAGTVKTARTNKEGLSIRYRYIKLEGEHAAARVAWAMTYGEWPESRVRFVDGDTLNLRIENLVLSNSVQSDHDHTTSEGKAGYQKEYRAAFPDRWKHHDLMRKYGIGLNDYVQMAIERGNKCEICGQPETQTRGGKEKLLSVDHDHATGKVRGLLCSECNQAIGKFKDSTAILAAAIRYLDKHQTGVMIPEDFNGETP
jgi:hypothetical protein